MKPVSKLNPSQQLAIELLKIEHQGRPLKIYIPDYDNGAMEDEDIENKIVFCTFHRSKGLERKIVYVLGVDESYHDFYDKYSDRNVCPNPIYVALTRSMEHLIILHHHTRDYLPSFNVENIKKYTNFIKNCSKVKDNKQEVDNKRKLYPSMVTQHMQNKYMVKLKSMTGSLVARKKQSVIDLPTKQKDDDNCERVAEINSFYISLIHQIFVSRPDAKTPKLYKDLMDRLTADDIQKSSCELYNKKVIAMLLKYSTVECGRNNGYTHKLKQIKRYNWLEPANVAKLVFRLNKMLSSNCEYEVRVEVPNCPEMTTAYASCELSGFIDIVDHKSKSVWEIKCVKELKHEHFVQLALYKYACLKNDKWVDYKYYLFNIVSGEIHLITATLPDLIRMVSYLVDKKYAPLKENNDDVFISSNSFCT
jgi:ATP-dependent exoDNAse (exonuclease V) beta subunit